MRGIYHRTKDIIVNRIKLTSFYFELQPTTTRKQYKTFYDMPYTKSSNEDNFIYPFQRQLKRKSHVCIHVYDLIEIEVETMVLMTSFDNIALYSYPPPQVNFFYCAGPLHVI